MAKNKFLWVIGPVVIGAIIAIIIAFSNNYAGRDMKLERAIYTIVEDKNNREFLLNALTEFTWDKAQIFGPYTPRKTIEAHLGVRFGQTGGLEVREDIFLLVFLHDDKAVKYVLLDRQDGVDFIQGKNVLTPSDDVVKIKRHSE